MIGYNQARLAPSLDCGHFWPVSSKNKPTAVAKKANFFVHASEMILALGNHWVGETLFFYRAQSQIIKLDEDDKFHNSGT